ncbi:sensor histidine kinase [Actinomadura sediminis]|uniref:histidine kinase n=1 Tax=Actinomadura sediminis TaxID=1038904 RepID=A0ABW3EP57_9ACTN
MRNGRRRSPLRRFRARVFALIVLVALVSTGATAWLTAYTTGERLTESAAVEQDTVDTVHRELVEYGTLHGTWEGVDRTVGELSARTGERIRLSTLDGVVIADTDTLAGRTARPPSARPATFLDARPRLADEPPAWRDGVVALIDHRRRVLRLATCLTRDSVPIGRADLGDGRWTVVASGPGGASESMKRCLARGGSSADERRADERELSACLASPPRAEETPVRDPWSGDGGPSPRCAERVYADRLRPLAPVTLKLELGFRDERVRPVAIEPERALPAAGAVAALVIVCTVLLSRRMLSSIAAVGQAALRLGSGDLSGRVRVRGDDEIADLAVAFNLMADSLQRSEERQRQMISDIAHELRTPLANIRGYLEALHDGVLAPDRGLFASLHEEAVLQQRLIDDLQELALAESGRLVLHRAPVDAAELLETVRTAHRAIAETAGVTLAVRAPGDGPPPIDADPDRLRQAIGNLVTNAVRATPPGGAVTLGVDVPDDPRAGGVVVTVADTGCGIGPEDLPRVFDRFWRADAARGRDTGGRGLGLAIAREIVLAHGGSLTAESTLGAGSTFTIRLPAAR